MTYEIVTFITVVFLLFAVMNSWFRSSRLLHVISVRDEKDHARYCREMHYLESLVYHVAYDEGRVSQKRIFELIPEMKACATCRKQLDLVFEFGVERKELLMDLSTKTAAITDHIRKMVENADYFDEKGMPGPIPKKKFVYSHDACHALEEAQTETPPEAA